MIDRQLRNRYSRQTMSPVIGEEGQAKLSKGSAVVIGCGGLGTNISTLLVRAGVGKIRIIDRDFIEYHNLQRQVLFDEEDIKAGLPKAIAAERHLKKVNSSVEIEGIVADVNYTNIEAFCSGADVILDGLDNFETRFLINDVSLKHKIPWVYGGAISASGMTMSIIPGKTACFRCFCGGLAGAGLLQTCDTAGVIGPAPFIVGALQSVEAMKILVGAEEVASNSLISINVWEGTFYRFKVGCRPDCPACQGKYEFLEEGFTVKTTSFCGQSRAVQVIDTRVREIQLDKLAARLKKVSDISRNEYMLHFTAGKRSNIVRLTRLWTRRAIIG